MNPIFSFIIPTFNRADIICEALESVRLEQEKTGWQLEILVADDFSNDNTHEVVAAWCKKENIDWLHYEKLSEKGGVCKARNNGVNRAKGEYLIFLDSDDQLLPNSLVHIKMVFEKRQEIDVYYGAIQKKSGSLGILPNNSFLERPLNYQQYISLKGLGEYLQICRASLLEDSRLRFCESINGFETYLWMQVLRQGAKLWIDPRPVRLYDDLRLDRLCHPLNLRHDSERLALGYLYFFNEFAPSIELIQPDYFSSLLLRVIFYHKVSNQWSINLYKKLQPEINRSSLKVKVLAKVPSIVIRLFYPLFNELRGSELLKKFE